MVATPVGNLEDLTFRARATLARVDRILAEDTRVTAKLLTHIGVAKRATVLNAHNEVKRTGEVLTALASGEHIALVSDAGTPAISDPGARLVRAAHEAGYRVVPVAGASAVAAAVSAAGLAAERFVFLGFLPAAPKARRALLATFGTLPAALVVFEAPHRVRTTVETLARELDGERILVIARELTKKFEEIARMPLAEAGAWLAADPNRERGEFVLVIDAPGAEAAPRLGSDSERWIEALLGDLPPSAVARVVAAVTALDRAEIYARALAIKASR